MGGQYPYNKFRKGMVIITNAGWLTKVSQSRQASYTGKAFRYIKHDGTESDWTHYADCVIVK